MLIKTKLYILITILLLILFFFIFNDKEIIEFFKNKKNKLILPPILGGNIRPFYKNNEKYYREIPNNGII